MEGLRFPSRKCKQILTMTLSRARVWRFQKILERKTIDEGKARVAVKCLQLNWFALDLVETDHRINSKNMYPGNLHVNLLWSFWLKIAYIGLDYSKKWKNKHCNVLNFGEKFVKFYQKRKIYKQNFDQNQKWLWFWLIFCLYISQIYFLKLRKNESKN